MMESNLLYPGSNINVNIIQNPLQKHPGPDKLTHKQPNMPAYMYVYMTQLQTEGKYFGPL